MRRRVGVTRRRAAAAGTLAGALLFVGGTATAYWASPGSGATTARTGRTGALRATGSVVGLLYPGGPARDLAVTVTNPGDAAVTVTSIRSIAVSAARGQGPCTVTGVTVRSTAVTLTVPARGTASVTLPGAVGMSSAAQTGCQGATFTVALEASGRVG